MVKKEEREDGEGEWKRRAKGERGKKKVWHVYIVTFTQL